MAKNGRGRDSHIDKPNVIGGNVLIGYTGVHEIGILLLRAGLILMAPHLQGCVGTQLANLAKSPMEYIIPTHYVQVGQVGQKWARTERRAVQQS